MSERARELIETVWERRLTFLLLLHLFPSPSFVFPFVSAVALPNSHPHLNFASANTDADTDVDAARHLPSSSQHGANTPYLDSPLTESSPAAPGTRREGQQDFQDRWAGHDDAELYQSQHRIFADQDAQLDTLSTSIGRQHHMSLQMNEELHEQSELLDELDEGVDRTGLRLGRASGQLDHVKRGLKDHGE